MADLVTSDAVERRAAGLAAAYGVDLTAVSLGEATNRLPSSGLETNEEAPVPEPQAARTTLADIYRNPRGVLPQELNPESLPQVGVQPPNFIAADQALVDGLKAVLPQLGSLEHTYFVVDIGHGHIPGVALTLMQHGVDPYLCISGRSSPRLAETAGHIAADYERALHGLDAPTSFATLVDVHRNDPSDMTRWGEGHGEPYQIDRALLPTVERLKELGITRVVFLREDRTRPDSFDPHAVVERQELLARVMGSNEHASSPIPQALASYIDAGLEFQAFGIDQREAIGGHIRMKRGVPFR